MLNHRDNLAVIGVNCIQRQKRRKNGLRTRVWCILLTLTIPIRLDELVLNGSEGSRRRISLRSRMSDLIDLNSPDVKRLINSKLSSPLIPVPRNIESNEQTSSLMEKRESLGSNPFDSVLYETADYVRKKGDPFEVMLQRALKCKSNKITNLEAQSVTFTDDFTPKCRKKFLKMMNKTLDESLIKDKTGIIGREKKEGTVSLVASNASVCDSNTAKGKKISL